MTLRVNQEPKMAEHIADLFVQPAKLQARLFASRAMAMMT